MTTEKQTLKLDRIRIDGGTQPRVAIDEQVVADYAEQYSTGVDLLPVTVFFDGTSYWLADGFHRYWANKRIDCKYIFAEVHPGSQRDAILYSVGANATHGLRRTNADKRKAVLIMLEDEEWSHWSDREIATKCGVGNEMVSRIRRSLCETDRESTSRPSRIYKTKHGTIARMKTDKIGRSRKSRPGKSPRIAKGAFQPQQFHGENGPVPMRSISLPLNNPQQAARSMLSLYGEEYMRTFAAELNVILQNTEGAEHGCTQ